MKLYVILKKFLLLGLQVIDCPVTVEDIFKQRNTFQIVM